MNEFSDQSTSKKKYSPEIIKKKKQGQTGHKLQMATFLDSYNYLGPPDLFGTSGIYLRPPRLFWTPGTFWDPWDLLCNIHCIEINLIYTYLFIYK